MLKTGMVSVTFRKLSPHQIVEIVKQCGLDGIEWGGDIHVPHGDLIQAKEVHEMMENSGLKTYAYGSYYRVGVSESNLFNDIIATAMMLDTKTIRVWAGNIKSCQANEEDWQRIIEDSKRIAKLAKYHNIDIAFEYHDHTLTDTNESAVKLVKLINQPNVYLYWQPSVGMEVENRLQGLQNIKDKLKNIHVFNWIQHERLPLIDGKKEWQLYLKQIPIDDKDYYCSLEFVRDDSINQFINDADVLKSLVDDINKKIPN